MTRNAVQKKMGLAWLAFGALLILHHILRAYGVFWPFGIFVDRGNPVHVDGAGFAVGAFTLLALALLTLAMAVLNILIELFRRLVLRAPAATAQMLFVGLFGAGFPLVALWLIANPETLQGTRGAGFGPWLWLGISAHILWFMVLLQILLLVAPRSLHDGSDQEQPVSG